jgi:hypothetical protein
VVGDGATTRLPYAEGPAWERLEDELGWYDLKSVAAQRSYKRVKLVQIVAAAAIPVLAVADISRIWMAAAGALLVILESVQQLYQWQTNWVQYRSTAEALKHEKSLYLAHAGPYAVADAQVVLAERIEGLISQEHAKWTAERAQSGAKDRATDGAETTARS